MANVRVLIAESTDIARSGLTAILNSSRTIDVVDSALSAEEAVRLYQKYSPDLCLISNSLNDLNIHKFMASIQKKDEEAKVVILSDTLDITSLNQALKAGVCGYLMKTINRKKLREFVHEAAAGEKVFSDSITNLMSDRYADLAQSKTRQKPLDQITKREAEILQLIVEGNTSQEIAELLYISPRTVETHRSNLLSKLKLKNTAGLVRFAIEQGQISRS